MANERAHEEDAHQEQASLQTPDGGIKEEVENVEQTEDDSTLAPSAEIPKDNGENPTDAAPAEEVAEVAAIPTEQEVASDAGSTEIPAATDDLSESSQEKEAQLEDRAVSDTIDRNSENEEAPNAPEEAISEINDTDSAAEVDLAIPSQEDEPKETSPEIAEVKSESAPTADATLRSAVSEVETPVEAAPVTDATKVSAEQAETELGQTESVSVSTEAKPENTEVEVETRATSAPSEEEMPSSAEIAEPEPVVVPTENQETEQTSKVSEPVSFKGGDTDLSSEKTSLETNTENAPATSEEVPEKKEVQPDTPKEQDLSTIDFSKLNAADILDVVKQAANFTNVLRADTVLKRTAERINALKKEARDLAKAAFEESEAPEQSFSFKQDEVFVDYDANFRLIKDKKSKYLKNLEREKELNFAKGEDILDRLRSFLEDSEDSTGFKKFKTFQQEWKELGPFPSANYKTLWANYNALVSLFYDRRSIYFDLIDLDRKKNLETKTRLCERVEALDEVKELRDAIVQLNELHHEFKHTGPVPRDDQEVIWQRFKKASDKVYAKRKVYNVELKKELHINLDKKKEIAEKVAAFTSFSSEMIKEWNAKTKEIMELQKSWEKVGGVPREQAKSINKLFWSPFKEYFHNKNQFFKKLEGDRQVNLELKQKLVETAVSLKDSTDWIKTSNDLKRLQREWREIGPVPEKFRNEIFKQFKQACDEFFTKRRTSSDEEEKNYVVNLEAKKQVIESIKKATKKSATLEGLKDLKSKFYDIGYVPKAEMENIQAAFNESVQDYLSNVEDIDEDEKKQFLFETKIEKIKSGPNADKKLYQKEGGLRKQISKMENDMTVWKNNIMFFSNTKNAEKLKNDFQKKIDRAEREVEKLKEELKLYASV